MRIAVGNDHRGLEIKRFIVERLKAQGHDVADAGSNVPDSVDYPDFARLVAGAVSRGEADRGILVCGSGIGMCIAANKFRGVRAALGFSPEAIATSREHNDLNVLCFPETMSDPNVVMPIVDAFTTGEFAGGRHQRRVDKIAQIEREQGSLEAEAKSCRS